MFNGTAASEIGAAAKYFKQDFVLPRDQLMKVRRFGHELVLARMKLVRHALADKSAGGTPRFLSFFSESCAPISTCMRAHAYLASGVAANKSFIDDKRPKPPEQLANNDVWKKEAAAICPKCEAAGILPHNLRYSPGWVTLWHGHAADLVANEQLHHPALTTWGWSKLVNMIPDESYWSTLANKFGHQITGDLTTYMEPGDPKTGHSKLFRENDVDRLWRTPAPNFFARKFPTTPRMDAALAERIRAAKGTEKANRQRR